MTRQPPSLEEGAEFIRELSASYNGKLNDFTVAALAQFHEDVWSPEEKQIAPKSFRKFWRRYCVYMEAAKAASGEVPHDDGQMKRLACLPPNKDYIGGSLFMRLIWPLLMRRGWESVWISQQTPRSQDG